jgi:major membrane immunogen (membrane-anchored lipoprotein)
MKTAKIIAGIIILVSLIGFSFHSKSMGLYNKASINDTSSNYLDGTYEGQSQASYAPEPFWGHIRIKIESGAFTEIDFMIRDSSIHEVVDSMYGVNHYSGTPAYMQQCVNDGHGIENYPLKLLESQNTENVDAVSGATWSYNIFIASAKEALKDAKKPTGIDVQSRDGSLSLEVSQDPVTSAKVFTYRLPGECHVNLSIYDIQGKLIEQLVNQEQSVGDHTIRWNDGPSEGIYCYRLKAGEKVISDKLICAKK